MVENDSIQHKQDRTFSASSDKNDVFAEYLMHFFKDFFQKQECLVNNVYCKYAANCDFISHY